MTEKQDTVPWIPGMRALDTDGHAWRLTALGVWFPDDEAAHAAGTIQGALSPDFTDLTTGAVVQWLVNAAEQREAVMADPTHPANVMASLRGGTDGGE